MSSPADRLPAYAEMANTDPTTSRLMIYERDNDIRRHTFDSEIQVIRY